MTCRACNDRGYILERCPRRNEIVKTPCDCVFGQLTKEQRQLTFWENALVVASVLLTLYVLWRLWP